MATRRQIRIVAKLAVRREEIDTRLAELCKIYKIPLELLDEIKRSQVAYWRAQREYQRVERKRINSVDFEFQIEEMRRLFTKHLRGIIIERLRSEKIEAAREHLDAVEQEIVDEALKAAASEASKADTALKRRQQIIKDKVERDKAALAKLVKAHMNLMSELGMTQDELAKLLSGE